MIQPRAGALFASFAAILGSIAVVMFAPQSRTSSKSSAVTISRSALRWPPDLPNYSRAWFDAPSGSTTTTSVDHIAPVFTTQPVSVTYWTPFGHFDSFIDRPTIKLASAEDPSPDEMLDEIQAKRALEKAVQVPRPYDPSFVAAVTPAGNVIVNGRAAVVAVAGRSPAGVLPARCRAEFAKMPVDTTLVCMPDDRLDRRVHGLPEDVQSSP